MDTQRADTADTSVRAAAMSSGHDMVGSNRPTPVGVTEMSRGSSEANTPGASPHTHRCTPRGMHERVADGRDLALSGPGDSHFMAGWVCGIHGQRAAVRQLSFREELINLLQRAGIPCDERYLNCITGSSELLDRRPEPGCKGRSSAPIDSRIQAFRHPFRGASVGWGRVTGGVRFARPPAHFSSPFRAGCGWMSCAARGGGLWWMDTQRADTADTEVRVAAMSSGHDMVGANRPTPVGVTEISRGSSEATPPVGVPHD
jgi:hypothetical protein